MPNLFGEPVPTPVIWSELSAGEAFDTWTDLAGWVTWLVRRFRLRPREVPPCWFRHAAVVEELTALWGSWRVAYGEDQPATSATDWLHMLFETRLRLAEWMARAGCTATDHRDDPDVAWSDSDPGLGRHVGADCAARSDPPYRPASCDGIEL